MSPMPDHVLAHLIRIGRLDDDGISRRAHARLCRACGAVTMAGLDDDKVAVTARVDPVPLSPLGEAQVLMSGRRTYALEYTSRGYRLDPRTAAHIRRAPAGSVPGIDVVGEHRCGAPAAPSAQSQVRAPYAAPGPADGPPPF